jgi:hypothetical protein
MAGGTGSGVDGKTSSYRSGSQASHAVVLKADLSEERFVQVQGQQQVESQEQQWIVVTTVLTNWEPAETSSQKGGLRADYETGASADPERSVDAIVDSNARAASQKPANAQPWSQMTITRLILKVYRASSLSTQPAVVPVQGGWLVLQL